MKTSSLLRKAKGGMWVVDMKVVVTKRKEGGREIRGRLVFNTIHHILMVTNF
jgi:hypothetical protein